MPSNTTTIPVNEMDRILNLYEFDIDYSNLESTFKDLALLAAKISGTDISIVNLIDTYTQWSVASFGLAVDQTPREDSLCQYTILENDHFEVEDLSTDIRFHDKPFVDSPLNLRYYFGVPLKTNAGYNIGSLCVLDKNLKKLTPEKIELLKIIANEIITRLNTIKLVQDLKSQLLAEKESNKKVAHDIRGPLSGIIGLTELIEEDCNDNDILELIGMINKSSHSVLDLADEILSINNNANPLSSEDFNLSIFKQKLEKLYGPQAKNKNIFLSVNINSSFEKETFKKDKLLQIAGNLISNAIKFTPNYGVVQVNLDLALEKNQKTLIIEVNDSGLGLDQESIFNILSGTKKTSTGTTGEKGYGYGLSMVKDLIKSIKGKMDIKSEIGKGAKFEILVPM